MFRRAATALPPNNRLLKLGTSPRARLIAEILHALVLQGHRAPDGGLTHAVLGTNGFPQRALGAAKKTPGRFHRGHSMIRCSHTLIPTLILCGSVAACSKKEAAPQKAAPKPAAKQAPVQTAKAAPKSLGPMKVNKDNPQSELKVALGNRLFFDKRLSADGSRACYTCHQNEDGTGGHEPTAIGAKGKALSRHAPVMWNVGYLPKLYWDGRADSLEAQAKGAWAGGNMGVGGDNLEAKAQEIGALPEYSELFDKAFPGLGATAATVAQALSAYERTLVCGDTAFDKAFNGDSGALSGEQKAGYDLFIGKAGCHSCHTPPFLADSYVLADGAYHNAGVGIEGKPEAAVDPGRMKVTKNPSDWGAFKTPTLRNITRSAPYMHDGSIATLEEAVRYMAKGGYKNKNLDAKLVDKKLTDAEIQQLVAFLGALECTEKLTPPG